MRLMFFSRAAREFQISNHDGGSNFGSVADAVEYYRTRVNNSGCYCLQVEGARVHVPTSHFPNFEVIRSYENGRFSGALDGLMTLEDYLAHESFASPQPLPLSPATSGTSADPLVSIDIKRGKVDGTDHGSALMLIVDARPLHDLLDTLGCEVVGDTYRNPPNSGSRVMDSSDNLSTTVLLRRQYPYKINLSEVYSNPPTIARLRHLAESANATVRRILEHYRPIDIRVTIQKQPVV